jgi:hypothetical protein
MREADPVSSDAGGTNAEPGDPALGRWGGDWPEHGSTPGEWASGSVDGAPSGSPDWSTGSTDESPGGRSGRLTWRHELIPLIGLLLVGALLAVVWRVLTPHTAKLGDAEEAAAAVDSTLVLLGVCVGIATAAWVLRWPGSQPVARTLTAIIGSLLGAVLCWQLGDLIGTPSLRATGAAFVWPFVTAAGLFLGALLPWTSVRLQPRDRPEPSPAPPSDPLSSYRPG